MDRQTKESKQATKAGVDIHLQPQHLGSGGGRISLSYIVKTEDSLGYLRAYYKN